MSKKSTYRSIGREIEAQRMTHSSGFSETLTEKELRSRANSLLQKPSMVKVYKNKKDGGIIKPMKLVEQLRNTYLNNNTNNQVITNNELVQSQPIQQIQQQCFEIDFDWLDYCDESKFKQIFKDDLKDISDMEQYVEENQSYLCHIFGQCACAKCTCNKCICSYKKKQELIYSCGMMTNNRFDYIPKQIKCMTPIITQSHYDNLVLPNQWMQLNSTSRDNYKWIQKEKTKNLNKSMYEPNNLPTGQTINNVRFLYLIDLLTLVNWKEYNQLIFKAPQFRTTVKGNFGQNKTNYRNQFIWKIKDENQTSVDDIKQKQQHQTISKIFPIQMRSIYQDSFIPKYQKTHRVNVKPEEILPCQPFQDFEGKQPNQQVITQKLWKGKLIKRLQNIQ